ncbi:MAG: hypothetical protein KGI71_05430 [Patescibacteria group bacterium]|nr:hypothetical protein [Patescibacteria group bacterium]
MKRVNPFDYFQMGWAVHGLIDLKADSTVGDNFLPLYYSRQWMDYLLGSPSVPVRVSRSACAELRRIVTEYMPANATAETYKNVLSQVDVYMIGEAAKTVETIIGAELQTTDTYYLDQKGAFSTPDLIERAEIVFSEGTRKQLSDGAVSDIRQSGRALALDLPTAAGFHIMRATESVVRDYYKVVTGRAPKSRTWGYYVRGLKDHNADAKVVAAIDQLRDLHRNPLMHPQAVLEEDEAVSLFGMAQSAISTMVADMARRAAATKTP